MSQEQLKPAVDSSLDGSDQFAVAKASSNICGNPETIPSVRTGTNRILRAKPSDYCRRPGGRTEFRYGRIVALRLMGKASFLKIIDRDGKIQSYVCRDEMGGGMPISRNSTLVIL